ncbi:WhiB family transcriptional regulator [Bounagaea algeriensis]
MSTVVTSDWRARANCRGASDPDAFFPLTPSAQCYAQELCANCPVAAECLSEALHIGADHGIWGGYTPEQRRGLRRTQEVAR